MLSLIIISNLDPEFKRIYFISMVNLNVRFELFQKVVQYGKDSYSIKLRTICLKVQNCSKVLTGGHVRGNTKTQFTHINIQTLHVISPWFP